MLYKAQHTETSVLCPAAWCHGARDVIIFEISELKGASSFKVKIPSFTIFDKCYYTNN